MSFFGGFSEPKFKAQLKMCIQRIKLVNNKIENECKRLKREIAGLLNKPRKEEEKAKIKCEHLIRGDHTMAAHCILELLCEALIARVKLISHSKNCPEDLLQAVSTMVYCSSRVDIPELKKITSMLSSKYGKSFVQRAIVNQDYNVNTTVIQKLNIANPKEGMVRNYLKSIADEFGFVWEPQEEKDAMGMSEAPVGRDVNPAGATGFSDRYTPDGAPILYGYDNGASGMNTNQVVPNAGAGGMGMGMGDPMATPAMLPGPPQFAQNDTPQFGQPQQPQYNTQPQFGQQQQQFAQQQPQFAPQQPQQQNNNNNPGMIGSFGVNPKADHSHNGGGDVVCCPTCGSMVPSTRLVGAGPDSSNGGGGAQPQPFVESTPLDGFDSLQPPPPGDMDNISNSRNDEFQQSTSQWAPPPPASSTNFSSESASSLLPPPTPDAGSNGGVMEDEFGIPMAPTSEPGMDSSSLPPPPPDDVGSNTAATDDNISPPPPRAADNSSPGGDAPDMDELMARFNNLMQ